VDPERARRRLAEERDRIEKQLAGLGVPEPADSPENSGDQAADLERAETDEGLRQELKSTLEAIARAEARLEDGTYGVSVISGEPIPDGRLEAIPWADRTVEEETGGRT
jgi:DnaK suppressor protein